MDVGNEFDVMLSLKFVMFGLLRFDLFTPDRNDKKTAKFHFLTVRMFWFELSVWKWMSGAEKDMKS